MYTAQECQAAVPHAKSERCASPAFALRLFNERVRQDNLKTLISVKYSRIQVLHQNLLFIIWQCLVCLPFAVCRLVVTKRAPFRNRTRASTEIVRFLCACMTNGQI